MLLSCLGREVEIILPLKIKKMTFLVEVARLIIIKKCAFSLYIFEGDIAKEDM